MNVAKTKNVWKSFNLSYCRKVDISGSRLLLWALLKYTYKKFRHFLKLFLVKLVKGDKQFLSCCNDQLFPDPIHDALKGVHSKCKEEAGDDTSSCFHTCVFKTMGFYGENGIDTGLVKKMMGAGNMMGEASDWKRANADKWIDECLKDTPSGQDCSQEILDLGHCYLTKIFTNCPSYNVANC